MDRHTADKNNVCLSKLTGNSGRWNHRIKREGAAWIILHEINCSSLFFMNHIFLCGLWNFFLLFFIYKISYRLFLPGRFLVKKAGRCAGAGNGGIWNVSVGWNEEIDFFMFCMSFSSAAKGFAGGWYIQLRFCCCGRRLGTAICCSCW